MTTKHIQVRQHAIERMSRRHDTMVDAAIAMGRIHRAGPRYDEAEQDIERATLLYREALDLIARLDSYCPGT